MSKFFRNNAGILIISFVYLLSFLYMLPLRDQIYGDDFAYLQTVRDFLRTGSLKISDWSYASMFFQSFWGALFGKVFGFSSKIMHLSTIVILYPGLIAFYFLLRELSIEKFKSVVFTLILFFFPHVFFMTYTFLTNIPSMSLAIISIYLYVKGLKKNKWKWYFFGSLISSLAFLNRQDAIVIPVAFLLISVFKKLAGVELKLTSLLFSFIPSILTVVFYTYWVSQPGNLTITQVRHGFQNPSGLSDTLIQFLPIPLGRIYTTNIYYAKYIQGFVFYFFHIIGFLLPVFFVFKVGIKRVLSYIIYYRRGIFLTTTIFLGLFSVEYIFRYSNAVYSIDEPTFVTVYSPLLHQYWEKMVVISIPIWLVLIGGFSERFFNVVFLRRRPLKFRFKFLTVSSLGFILYLYIKSFLLVYQSKVPYNESLIVTARAYLNVLNSPTLVSYLKGTWLVPSLYFILILVATYLFCFFKLKKRFFASNGESAFLVFIFVLYMIIHIFFMRFRWPQYIPTLIPYIIIWLACLSDSTKISLTRSILVIIIFIAFSVSSTKTRYELDGFQFQLASKLVEKGVKPIDIETDTWVNAWLPWWYYKSTLEEAIRKAGGNKYEIGGVGTWHVLQDYKTTYRIAEVPLDYKPEKDSSRIIVEDTGTQYSSVFSKKRFVVYKDIKD